MTVEIRLRRDTAANWTSVNPVLGVNELGIESDTDKEKIGDGTSAWTALPYRTRGATDGAALWPQITNLPLTTLSGWTAGAGTWAADANGIAQTTDSAAVKRLHLNTRLDLTECIVEVEIKIATASSTASSRAGLVFGTPWAVDDKGAALVSLLSTTSSTTTAVDFETESVTNHGSDALAAPIAHGTWMKFKVHKAGSMYAAYVNDVLVGTGNIGDARRMGRLALYSYATSASWRNLKVWTPNLDVAATAGSGASTLDALTDVNTTTAPPADGQPLEWDAATATWRPGGPTQLVEAQVTVPFKATGAVTANTPFGWTPTGAQVGDVAILTVNCTSASTFTIDPSWTAVASNVGGAGYYGMSAYLFTKTLTAADLDAESITSSVGGRFVVHYLHDVETLGSAVRALVNEPGTNDAAYKLPAVTASAAFVALIAYTPGAQTFDFPAPYTDELGGNASTVTAHQGLTNEPTGEVTVTAAAGLDWAVYRFDLTPKQVTVAVPASLDTLADVDTTTTPPTDGQTLVYNVAAGLWAPGTPAGGGGPTRLTNLTKTADQTLTSLNWTTLTWTTEESDDLGAFDTAASATRLVAPTTGVYEINCYVALSGCTTNTGRGLRIKKNGTPVRGRTMVYYPNAFGELTLEHTLKLNAGDYIEVDVYGEGAPVAVAAQYGGESGTRVTMALGGSGGGGGGGLLSRRSKRTTGNITVNSASWADVDNSLDLVIPAAVGDVLECTILAAAYSTGGTYLVLDLQTVVGATPINSVGHGGAASASLSHPTWGTPSVLTDSGGATRLVGSQQYVTQAGDLENGSVRLRLRGRSGGAAILKATGDPSLNVAVVNLGPESGA